MERVRVGLCLLVVLAVVVPAGTAPLATTALAQEEPTPEDDAANETVRHRDPEAVDGRGNVEQVRAWLVGELSGRLADGTVELSQDQYEQARRLLGDDYSDRLGQLVDVAGETETTRTLERTRERQRELTNATEAYRETRETYETARDRGDTERARELARELERIEERVNESAAATAVGYQQLGEQTGRDFSEATANVEETAAEISATQAAIRRSLFVETELTVRATDESISFLDPLAIDGRLTAANGTAITDRVVTVAVGERRFPVVTDETGAFTLSYRPVALPRETETVSVEFVPRNESVYLGASATLPVEVEQVTPTLSVDEPRPDSAAFSETVTVTGRVTAEGEGVPVPVVALIDGRQVGTGQATADGSYALDVQLPAGVDEGIREVVVRIPLEGRAVASAEERAALTVTETGTELTVEAAQAEASLRVTGELATVGERAVAGQPVEIAIDGRTITTVRTGPDGGIDATVDLPDEVEPGPVTVAVSFDRPGTNLGPSRAETTLELSAIAPADPGGGDGPGGDGGLPFGDLGVVVIGAAIALVGAVVLGVLLVRSTDGLGGVFADEPDEDDAVDPGDDGSTTGGASTPERTGGVSAGALLERAREQLAGGDTDEAVVSSYLAVRRRFEGGDEGQTHWEFYRDRARELDETASATLREVTEGYERAAFAPGVVPAGDASTLVERAATVGDQSSASSGS